VIVYRITETINIPQTFSVAAGWTQICEGPEQNPHHMLRGHGRSGMIRAGKFPFLDYVPGTACIAARETGGLKVWGLIAGGHPTLGSKQLEPVIVSGFG
jgi:hypothetical protein